MRLCQIFAGLLLSTRPGKCRARESFLYFTNQKGDHVWRLPAKMDAEFARPEIAWQAEGKAKVEFRLCWTMTRAEFPPNFHSTNQF